MRITPLGVAALLMAVPAGAARPQHEGGEAGATNQSREASGITAIVDAEFPAYDVNRSGQLEQPEFIKWMVALKDHEMKATGKKLPATEVTAWASGAFTSADADGSGAVSKEELLQYLTSGTGG